MEYLIFEVCSKYTDVFLSQIFFMSLQYISSNTFTFVLEEKQEITMHLCKEGNEQQQYPTQQQSKRQANALMAPA